MLIALEATLTKEKNQTLQELEMAQAVSRRIKQRATALRLNAKEWRLKKIAD